MQIDLNDKKIDGYSTASEFVIDDKNGMKVIPTNVVTATTTPESSFYGVKSYRTVHGASIPSGLMASLETHSSDNLNENNTTGTDLDQEQEQEQNRHDDRDDPNTTATETGTSNPETEMTQMISQTHMHHRGKSSKNQSDETLGVNINSKTTDTEHLSPGLNSLHSVTIDGDFIYHHDIHPREIIHDLTPPPPDTRGTGTGTGAAANAGAGQGQCINDGDLGLESAAVFMKRMGTNAGVTVHSQTPRIGGLHKSKTVNLMSDNITHISSPPVKHSQSLSPRLHNVAWSSYRAPSMLNALNALNGFGRKKQSESNGGGGDNNNGGNNSKNGNMGLLTLVRKNSLRRDRKLRKKFNKMKEQRTQQLQTQNGKGNGNDKDKDKDKDRISSPGALASTARNSSYHIIRKRHINPNLDSFTRTNTLNTQTNTNTNTNNTNTNTNTNRTTTFTNSTFALQNGDSNVTVATFSSQKSISSQHYTLNHTIDNDSNKTSTTGQKSKHPSGHVRRPAKSSDSGSASSTVRLAEDNINIDTPSSIVAMVGISGGKNNMVSSNGGGRKFQHHGIKNHNRKVGGAKNGRNRGKFGGKGRMRGGMNKRRMKTRDTRLNRHNDNNHDDGDYESGSRSESSDENVPNINTVNDNREDSTNSTTHSHSQSQSRSKSQSKLHEIHSKFGNLNAPSGSHMVEERIIHTKYIQQGHEQDLEQEHKRETLNTKTNTNRKQTVNRSKNKNANESNFVGKDNDTGNGDDDGKINNVGGSGLTLVAGIDSIVDVDADVDVDVDVDVGDSESSFKSDSDRNLDCNLHLNNKKHPTADERENENDNTNNHDDNSKNGNNINNIQNDSKIDRNNQDEVVSPSSGVKLQLPRLVDSGSQNVDTINNIGNNSNSKSNSKSNSNTNSNTDSKSKSNNSSNSNEIMDGNNNIDNIITIDMDMEMNVIDNYNPDENDLIQFLINSNILATNDVDDDNENGASVNGKNATQNKDGSSEGECLIM